MRKPPRNRRRLDLGQVIKLIVAITSLVAAIHSLLK